MNEASLSESGDGRWILAGNLDFATVPQVWPALERVLGLPGSVDLKVALDSTAVLAPLAWVLLPEERE